MSDEEQKKLLDACRVLVNDFSIEDYIYDVREREGDGWHGPRVEAFSKAVMVLKQATKDTD